MYGPEPVPPPLASLLTPVSLLHPVNVLRIKNSPGIERVGLAALSAELPPTLT